MIKYRLRSVAALFILVCVAETGVSAIAASDAPVSSAWTRINDDDAAVSYSGKVEASSIPEYYGGDMHSSNVSGAWSKFSFSGTGVKWIGSKNKDHGKADVYLDGKFETTVDTSAPSWLKQQELFAKTGLNDGPHVLMIQVRTQAYQDFDAF
jgi:hypothetical protein